MSEEAFQHSNTAEQRLAYWEQISRTLELDAVDYESYTQHALRVARDYYDHLDQTPVRMHLAATDETRDSATARMGFTEQGQSPEQVFGEIETRVCRSGLREGSGRLFGFIPGTGLYTSALGDYLAAVTNRFVGASYAAPGSVRMEQELTDWLAQELGYPQGAAGDLTSGGSVANLSAVVAAREAHGIQPEGIRRCVVYCTALTHHATDKALRVAGMHHSPMRRIEMDERYHMRPEALERQIQEDRKAGLYPWLLVGNAGATDTGSVDPLSELADIAAHYQLWFNADGAYGAAFALCATGRRVLRGLERTDSLIIDPHKSLFLPYGSGAVLVRDAQHLRAAFSKTSPCLQDSESMAPGDLREPHEYSVELSRHFRGLRLWLPLKLHGLAPFRAALEEKLLLARYCHQRLQEIPGMEVGPCPDLSIINFRFIPPRGDADAFNRQLVDRIQQEGQIFLTSTVLDGHVTLRLVVLGYRTHRDTIDDVLTYLQAVIGQLLNR